MVERGGGDMCGREDVSADMVGVADVDDGDLGG